MLKFSVLHNHWRYSKPVLFFCVWFLFILHNYSRSLENKTELNLQVWLLKHISLKTLVFTLRKRTLLLTSRVILKLWKFLRIKIPRYHSSWTFLKVNPLMPEAKLFQLLSSPATAAERYVWKKGNCTTQNWPSLFMSWDEIQRNVSSDLKQAQCFIMEPGSVSNRLSSSETWQCCYFKIFCSTCE